MKRKIRLWLPLLLLSSLALACGGGRDRAQKAHRSAVWVAPGAPLEFADVATLETVGIKEMLVEAGHLAWSGGRPRIEPVATLSLPQRTGVTLVVRGSFPGAGLDTGEAAKALGKALAGLAAQARSQGLEALGFHLDVDAGGNLASYGEMLAELRKELGERQFLSVSLERGWLDEPEVEKVAKAADFVVAFLYGQRPGEPEDDAAWDLQKVEANLRRLEKLGRPYLMGVVTLGRAFDIAGGRRRGETSRVTVAELVRNGSLALEHGSLLEGVDRMVYDFVAQSPTRVGEWSLQRGERIKVVGLASYHLEELQRFLGALDLPHRLGDAYFRLPATGERLALSLANLVNALSSEPAQAVPTLHLTPAGGHNRYTVAIENASDEPTDVILLGSNYVEIRVDGGSIGRVDPGGFLRWELLADDGKGGVTRAFRGAPILRLYTPMLDAHQTVKSGVIEVSSPRGAAAVRARGSFVLPGGTTVEAKAGA